MYGCDTMMMGGEPIEKSNEDDTSISIFIQWP